MTGGVRVRGLVPDERGSLCAAADLRSVRWAWHGRNARAVLELPEGRAQLVLEPTGAAGWQPSVEVLTDGMPWALFRFQRWHSAELSQARLVAFYGGCWALAEQWLRAGVPEPAALAAYDGHLWVGRDIGERCVVGRFVRSVNGTTRFETDARVFYELRDGLASWIFAPVASRRGAVIPRWWLTPTPDAEPGEETGTDDDRARSSDV